MRAHARLAVTAGHGRRDGSTSHVSELRSDPPLVLRPTHAGRTPPVPGWTPDAASGQAWVCLAAGAAGPIGGDHLRLEVDVGPRAVLVLRDVAARLLLPDPRGRPSSSTVTVTVGEGGTFVWLAEPVIAARGCLHEADTRVDLQPGARLLVREELILGRHGETPGTVRQRLRVCIDGRPLHDQELRTGPGYPGWDGAAVTGGNRCVGSMLRVDDALRGCGAGAGPNADDDAVLLRLDDRAVLASAVAPDSLALRHLLARQISGAGP